jgi:hypothetical protein
VQQTRKPQHTKEITMSQAIIEFNNTTTASGFIANLNALQDHLGKIVIDGYELEDNIFAAGRAIATFYSRMPKQFQVDVACVMPHENYVWRTPIETAVSAVFRQEKLWKN